MFYDVVLEGLKKFAGEIIGVILLIVAWRIFPGLRKLFGQYNSLKNDSDNEHTEPAIKKSDDSKPPIMSDKDFVNLCKSGNVSEIEEAIKNGANVNAKDHGTTPLMGVLQCNVELAELAELLIKKGADVNAKDNFGNTVLMRPAIRNYTKTAELLIKYGADINAKNNCGMTALIWSENKGHTEIADLLRRYGAKE